MRLGRARTAPGRGRVRWAAAAVATATLCALLSACGSDEEPRTTATDGAAAGGTAGEPSPSPVDAGSGSDGSDGSDGSEGSGPGRWLEPTSFAVAPPGKRRDPLTAADIMVTSSEAMDSDTVAAIEDLDGVASVTPISVASVPLENKVYTLAAVDSSTYRLFTPQNSADFDEQWKRVAGGEVAVAAKLQDRLPTDADDYLDLELGEDSMKVHVGAFAPQVAGVDMAVNVKLGEALGMTPGNALLVSTGSTAPDRLRRPIEEVTGDDASLQNLDVVARRGLDPGAFQNAVLVGSFADAVGTYRYTPNGNGTITPDSAWVSEHIRTEVVPILGSVTCNKDLFPQLKAALQEVVQQGLASTIHASEYAGCYYPRFIAGTTTLSNHSFGLALDMNVPGNQRGTVGEMDRGVVAIFKRWGFAWGGDWNYTDPMHFELARLVRPGG